jgi:hypothetical protein
MPELTKACGMLFLEGLCHSIFCEIIVQVQKCVIMIKKTKNKALFILCKIQLCRPLIVLAIFVASCNSQNVNENNSSKDSLKIASLTASQNTSLDSIVLFLLDASAKDFHDNQPPIPVNFRNVQVRYLIGQNAENNYLICGQFLDRDKQSKDEWTSFATIKTDPYEQWIGSNALAYCQDSKAIDYKINDLSLALKNRIDSLQNTTELTK